MLTWMLHSELAREKMWSRIHLIPVLQAEEDRDLVRRHLAQSARERELLGAETKVYNNDRCVYGEDGATSNGSSLLTTGLGSCGRHTRSLRATPRSSWKDEIKGRSIVHTTAFMEPCRLQEFYQNRSSTSSREQCHRAHNV